MSHSPGKLKPMTKSSNLMSKTIRIRPKSAFLEFGFQFSMILEFPERGKERLEVGSTCLSSTSQAAILFSSTDAWLSERSSPVIPSNTEDSR